MITIQNPGRFRSHLILDYPDDIIPLRRIIPEAKARNPKLADVLRVYRKWEGKGIGMATLVNLCLENRIDLPTYRLYTDEVKLMLRAGKLLDEIMESWFQSFDRYIGEKTGGFPLSVEQKLVLAYLVKAEWATPDQEYSIILTPDNNHFKELRFLEGCGLIAKHPRSTPLHSLYIADRELVKKDYRTELREIYGDALISLDGDLIAILNTIYRHDRFCASRSTTARIAAFSIWHERQGSRQNIREFDAFYRQVKYRFNKLESAGLIRRSEDGKGYSLNRDFGRDLLL